MDLAKINAVLYKYIQYMMNYVRNHPNCHHRLGTGYHSLWSARAAYNILTEKYYNFTYDMEDTTKSLALIFATFHDIGKDDLCTPEEICDKSQHPEVGYRNIMFLKDQIDRNEYKTTGMGYDMLIEVSNLISLPLAFFALISRYHQIGREMFATKNGEERGQLAANIIERIRAELDYHHVSLPPNNFNNFIKCLLIASLADVLGARRQPGPKDQEGARVWTFMNEGVFPEKDGCGGHPSCYECKDPFIEYGYEKHAVKRFIEPILQATRYIVPETSMISSCQIEFRKITRRTTLYKASRDEDLSEKSKARKDPTWLSTTLSTALTYKKQGWNYIHKFKCRKGVTLHLIELSDVPTLTWIYGTLVSVGSADLANKLFQAFQSNLASPLRLSRYSVYAKDRELMDRVICKLSEITEYKKQINGYFADVMPSYDNKTFHEELAVCDPSLLEYDGRI